MPAYFCSHSLHRLKTFSALLSGAGSGGIFLRVLMQPGEISGSSRNSIRRLNHFSRGGHEFVQSRARNNDCVAPAVRFFGDTHKPAALVFSEFYIEVLTLNLQLSRYDDIVHDIFWRDTDTITPLGTLD
jgi:hypothetical protein